MQIDTADVVLHKPTGERWVVAYVRDDRLAWVGWPEGEAALSDCELVSAASDEQRLKLLQQMAQSRSDARARYARHRLGIRDGESP